MVQVKHDRGNGKPPSGDVERRNITWFNFLRENLHLTGTHVGCDTSQMRPHVSCKM